MSTSSEIRWQSTTVMSCTANVLLVGGDASHAIARLQQLERRWSRFLPDSEVTALNRSGGATTRVSADTIELITAMQRGWCATNGRFDPMLLAPLIDLGYATSRCDPSATTTVGPDWQHVDPRLIEIDVTNSTVTMPRGATIDPGGIGKGLAADRLVDELLENGARGALVEIGGDVRVGGEAPNPEVGWTIGVGTSSVGLTTGAVATSTTARRTWQSGGEQRHHLIDPATLQPSDNGVRSCTVIAGTGAWAEVFTKVAFGSAVTDAITTYHEFGLAAAITTTDGAIHTTDGWKTFQR